MPARECMEFSGNRTRRKATLFGWRPGAANPRPFIFNPTRPLPIAIAKMIAIEKIPERSGTIFVCKLRCVFPVIGPVTVHSTAAHHPVAPGPPLGPPPSRPPPEHRFSIPWGSYPPGRAK